MQFRGFHEGRTARLPGFYRKLYKKRLGRYAELLSEADMTPALRFGRAVRRSAAGRRKSTAVGS